MWILKNTSSDEYFYMTGLHVETYSVGRIGCDLILRQDASISRSHAILKCLQKEDHNIEIKDAGSLHGTYINDNIYSNSRLPKGESQMLKDGDIIRFGRFQNIWCINYKPFVTTMSMLTSEEVMLLEVNLKSLGGKVLQYWDMKCTHLTMNEIVITIKFLHALLENKPIVTTQYWQDLIKNVQEKKALPNPDDYVPKFNNKLLVDCDISTRTDRKRLFIGLTFVFLNSKQMDLYAPIVRKAGGISTMINSKMEKIELLNSSTIVVQYISSADTQNSPNITNITEHLKIYNRRIIPEYEIGMAIINCSTDKFCNPAYENFIQCAMTDAETQNTILVENTNLDERNSNYITHDTQILIPETRMNLRFSESEKISEAPMLFVSETDDEDDPMSSMCVTQGIENVSHNYMKRKRNPDCKELYGDSKQIKLEKCSLNTKEARKVVKDQDVELHSIPSNKEKIKPSPPHSHVSVKPLMGFLEKTQLNSCKNVVNNHGSLTGITGKEEHRSKTRGRIAVLSDEDDKKDLFNFRKDQSVPQKKEKYENFDEEIFEHFKSNKSKYHPNKSSKHANLSIMPTESLKLDMSLPKPKTSPNVVNVNDWHSSMQKLKTNEKKSTQTDVCLKKEECEEKMDMNWWLNFQGGFEVRKTPITEIRRQKDINLFPTCTQLSENITQKIEKNFKRFKKQQVTRASTLVKTTRVPVV